MNIKKSGEGRLSAEERREAILDAAVVEFAALGFYGASTERIAANVGISQPYIFRLFGTKKELFLASVARVIDTIKLTLREAVKADPSNPLAAVYDAFNRLMHQRDELVLLLQAFASAKDPDMMQIGRLRLAEMYSYVAEITGADERELQQFFAYGMLFIVAATLDIQSIAPEQPWAANLIRPWP
jgi:TetR/AcrR family transcriptional regulator